MSTVTVTIREATQPLLQELAEKTGQSPEEVLHKALVAYQRSLVSEQGNATGDAKLRANPEALAEYQADRKEWDAT